MKRNDNQKDESMADDKSIVKSNDEAGLEQKLIPYYSDEEPENFETQKEDMKQYLNKLNKRVDTLVEALKQADQMMAKMGDQKALIE